MAENIQNLIAIGVNENVSHPVVVMGNKIGRLMGEHMVPSMV